MPALLKLIKFKIIMTVSLLFLANITVFAQQDQQTKSAPVESNTATKIDSKTKSSTQVTTVEIPSPTPLTKQHKEDLKHYLPSDKVKALLAGPDDYLTLITENTRVNNKGVMVLLPDWQQGATNPKAINFLRNKLPQQGWTTISIQPASKPENYPSKALETKEQQKENKILLDAYKMKFAAMINAVVNKASEYPGIVVIVAQGNHGAMLVDLFDEQNSNQGNVMPNAVILLSSYLLTNEKLIDDANTDFAKKIAYSEYPILDLYLRYDHPIVLDKTKQRSALSKKEMKVYYRQRQLNNNNVGYYPEQELITQINGWLKSIGW